jgi:hypothetical protein
MQGRVLVPVPLILNAKSFRGASSLLKDNIKNNAVLDDTDIDINMTREIIKQVMRTLISQSAHKITLIWNNRDLENEVMEEFPTRLKGRIRPVYLTDIPSNFLSLLEPICNDKIRSPTLDILVNDIFLLYTACKEQTELDICSTLNVLNNWDSTFATSNYLKYSSDVQDLLSELKGLINSYRYKEDIESFRDINQDIPVDKRIDDFLNDGYVEKLSAEKYFFGIPSRFKQSIFKFKQIIKEHFLDRCEIALNPFFFAETPFEVTIPLWKKVNYYPPISPLKQIYSSKINDHILSNRIGNLYFIETMPAYKAGFTFYECNGKEVNQSLYASGLEFKGEYCLGGNKWVNIDLSNNKTMNIVF